MARWDIDNNVSVDTKRQYLAKWSQYLNYHQIFSANIVSDFDSSCVVESSKIAGIMMSSIGSIDKNVFDLVEWRSLVTFITFFSSSVTHVARCVFRWWWCKLARQLYSWETFNSLHTWLRQSFFDKNFRSQLVRIWWIHHIQIFMMLIWTLLTRVEETFFYVLLASCVD